MKRSQDLSLSSIFNQPPFCSSNSKNPLTSQLKVGFQDYAMEKSLSYGRSTDRKKPQGFIDFSLHYSVFSTPRRDHHASPFATPHDNSPFHQIRSNNDSQIVKTNTPTGSTYTTTPTVIQTAKSSILKLSLPALTSSRDILTQFKQVNTPQTISHPNKNLSLNIAQSLIPLDPNDRTGNRLVQTQISDLNIPLPINKQSKNQSTSNQTSWKIQTPCYQSLSLKKKQHHKNNVCNPFSQSKDQIHLNQQFSLNPPTPINLRYSSQPNSPPLLLRPNHMKQKELTNHFLIILSSCLLQ